MQTIPVRCCRRIITCCCFIAWRQCIRNFRNNSMSCLESATWPQRIFSLIRICLNVCELFSRRQKPLEHFKVEEFFFISSVFCSLLFYPATNRLMNEKFQHAIKNSCNKQSSLRTMEKKEVDRPISHGLQNMTEVLQSIRQLFFCSLFFFALRWTHLLNQWLWWFICRRAKYTSISELSK